MRGKRISPDEPCYGYRPIVSSILKELFVG